MSELLEYAVTCEVSDRCLCLHLQRAGRVVARMFDAALRPLDLTNGQFSILNALNRPKPPRLTELARFLGMDHSTMTAAVKPLERRGLMMLKADTEDRRGRLASLTGAGHELLVKAVPIWRVTHDRLDELAGENISLGALNKVSGLIA